MRLLKCMAKIATKRCCCRRARANVWFSKNFLSLGRGGLGWSNVVQVGGRGTGKMLQWSSGIFSVECSEGGGGGGGVVRETSKFRGCTCSRSSSIGSAMFKIHSYMLKIIEPIIFIRFYKTF